MPPPLAVSTWLGGYQGRHGLLKRRRRYWCHEPLYRLLCVSSLALLVLSGVLCEILSAQESAVFRLVVNTEDKGETFAMVMSDGDVMVPRSTLSDIGLEELPHGQLINEEPYVSLHALSPSVQYETDAQQGVLLLTVSPERFTPTKKEYFFNQPPPNLQTTFTNSAFLNYSAIATDEKAFVGTGEVAGRWGHWLGRSTFTYNKTDSLDKFNRLLTNATHDDPGTQRRITVGDVSAFSRFLGSGTILGGIGVSRNFGLTPYFYPTPGLDLTGLLQTPSEIETYVNGRLVRRERLGPGGFTLQNIPVNNGLNNTTIIIRDAFQRVTQIDTPFYMAPQLLKQGLSEYSYSMEFRRSNLGIESNDYREWQVMAVHRYGFTKGLTAGFRGEASAQRINAGPVMNVTLGSYGQVDSTVAVSQDGQARGYGTLSSYTYASGVLSARVDSIPVARLCQPLSILHSRQAETCLVGQCRRRQGALRIVDADLF